MMQQNSISAASVGDILQNLKSMTILGKVEKNAEPERTNIVTKNSPEIKHANNGSLFNSGSLTGNYAQTPPKGVNGQIRTAESGMYKNPFSSSNSNSASNSPEVDSFKFKSPPAPLFTPAKPTVALFTNSVTNNLFTEPKNAPLAALNNNNNARLQAGFVELLQRSKIADQSTNRTADIELPGPFSTASEDFSKIDSKVPVFQFDTTGSSFPPSLSKESEFSSNSQAQQPTFTLGSDTSNHKSVNKSSKLGKNGKIRLSKQHLASLNQPMAPAPADGGWFWGKDSGAAEKNEDKEKPKNTTADSIPITTATFNFQKLALNDNDTVKSDMPFSFTSSSAPVPPSQSNSATSGPFSSEDDIPRTDSAYSTSESAPIYSSDTAAIGSSGFNGFSTTNSTFSSSHSAPQNTFPAPSVSFAIGAKDKTTKAKSKSINTVPVSAVGGSNFADENPLFMNKFGTLPSIRKEAPNPLLKSFTAPSLFSNNDGSYNFYARS